MYKEAGLSRYEHFAIMNKSNIAKRVLERNSVARRGRARRNDDSVEGFRMLSTWRTAAIDKTVWIAMQGLI